MMKDLVLGLFYRSFVVRSFGFYRSLQVFCDEGPYGLVLSSTNSIENQKIQKSSDFSIFGFQVILT